MPPHKNRKRKEQLNNARGVMLTNKRHFSTEATSGMQVETECESSVVASASCSKIERMRQCGVATEDGQQMWTLTHVRQLTHLLSDVLCPECFQNRLTVGVVEKENCGFAAKLKLSCVCGYEKCEFSSPRIMDSEKQNVPFEINPKMVLFSHEVGKSHTALQTFGSVIGMPTMHLTTYQGHDKKITDHEVDAGEEMLQSAARAVREAYADVDPDLKEALERGETPVIDISVSYDGTWQKRGFTSLYGVGVCIDLLTGLVVDFDIRSKYCHACKMKEASGLSKEELAAWKVDHSNSCCANHSKSSKAMEQESAITLWGRSMEKLKFRYVDMLGDGDSSAYKSVCDLKPYGETKVEKLECVNHAHKRMGTALRKLSKEERLGGHGDGRLTEKKCDILQNFYRGAIIDNIPDIDKMRSAVWAGLYHSMSTDKEPQHRQCPRGENSWCWYQKALARGEEPGSHEDHKATTFVSLQVAHKMIPVFQRMSDEALLRRMAHGGTQNTNECLNSTIWARCPKTSFMGMARVQGSVARAVCAFNEGATEILSIMNRMYMDISHITLDYLFQKDQKRIRKASAVKKAEACQHRKSAAIR